MFGHLLRRKLLYFIKESECMKEKNTKHLEDLSNIQTGPVVCVCVLFLLLLF